MPVETHSVNLGVPPLGIAYLAGNILDNSIQIQCIDAVGEKLDQFFHIKNNLIGHGLRNQEILERVYNNVALIGVSVMFASDWMNSKLLIASLKDRFPRALVVLGGEYSSADASYILESTPEVDIIVHGEGEHTFAELCKRIKSGETFFDVEGISYKSDSQKIIKNPSRPRIKQIDTIKLPNWDLLPIEKYLDTGRGHGSLYSRSMPMLASRGCPYRCSFCSNLQMWTQRWVARNPDLVIEEIELYVKKYNINHVEFYDLTTIIDRDWIIDFCKKLVDKKLNITWSLPTGTRSEVLDFEVLQHLKASGCQKITLAPESGSTKTLKDIRKKIDPNSVLRIVSDSRNCGLISRLNIIYGFPNQDWSQIFESILFIWKAAFRGANDVACFAFAPYPGSELFEQLVHQKKIIRDENYIDFLSQLVFTKSRGNVSWSNHLSGNEITLLVWFSMGSFYFISFVTHPIRLFQTIFRLVKLKPQTTLETLIVTICHNILARKKLKYFKRTA